MPSVVYKRLKTLKLHLKLLHVEEGASLLASRNKVSFVQVLSILSVACNLHLWKVTGYKNKKCHLLYIQQSFNQVVS